MIDLLKSKKVKVGTHEFILAYSIRATFAHMKRIKDEPENMESLINYYYDLCKAGAKLEDREFNYTFDEFYDAIDNYYDALTKFDKALAKITPDESKKK